MKIKKLLVLVSLIFFAQQSEAKLRLPALFSDHMVLQRDTTVTLWGWADPNEKVKVVASWNPNDTLITTGNSHAKWKLALQTTQKSGPHTLTFIGYNTITLSDVLLGEVWIASGQSNMQWTASAGIDNKEDAIAGANNANLRFFNVPHTSSEHPQDDVQATWEECTPETMQHFSAIAYFFGKKLNEELDVPVGLISSSWGGSPAETWIPEDRFVQNDSLTKAAELMGPLKWCPNEPGRAYNGMIAPLINYTLAGVIWYQGETNTGNAAFYESTFTSLIKSWREDWGSSFPFYFAQIAPYNYGDNFSGVEVRDAQRRTLKAPNTGMVVLGDLGSDDDIHPKNKRDPGLRFANLALAKHYGKDIQAESPLIDKVISLSETKVEVSFKNGNGIHFSNKGRSNAIFELAGKDGKFQQVSKVKITDDNIIIRSSVENPEYLRYGWGNIAIPGIYNAANLPLSSFKVQIN